MPVPGLGMNLVKLMFGFSGRTGRAMLWLAALIWAITIVVVFAILMVMASLDAAITSAMYLSVLAFVSCIAVGITRLHDRNKNPLWLLLFYGAPIVLVYLSSLLTVGNDPGNQPMIVSILGYVWLAVTLWGLVELGMIRGSIGPNPHGPDPVAPKPAPARAAH